MLRAFAVITVSDSSFRNLDVAAHLGGRGPGVQHHDLALADHLRGGIADADLLAVMERLLDVDGGVLQCAHALQRRRRASG